MPEYEKETTEQQRLEKEQLEDLGTVWRTRGPHAIHCIGGAKRDRTADPLRARQVLSQLS